MVTVDAEELLLVQCGKHLAQRGLSTACFTNQEDWLLVLEAFVDEDRQSPELPADDELWNPQLHGHVFKCLTKIELVKISLVEACFVYLAPQGGLDGLFDEFLVLHAPRSLTKNQVAFKGNVLSCHALVMIYTVCPFEKISDSDG